MPEIIARDRRESGWKGIGLTMGVLDHFGADVVGVFAPGSAGDDEGGGVGRVEGSGVFEALDRDRGGEGRGGRGRGGGAVGEVVWAGERGVSGLGVGV